MRATNPIAMKFIQEREMRLYVPNHAFLLHCSASFMIPQVKHKATGIKE